MVDFRLGPFRFQFLPDGDDQGFGLMRVTLNGEQTDLACTRDDWDEFAVESGPGWRIDSGMGERTR